MTIALVQQYTAGTIAGDASTGSDTTKPDVRASIAWPTATTAGNRLIMWQATDDTNGTTTARTGWTEVGSTIASSDYAGSTLRVWYKTADGTETQHSALDLPIGNRVAMGLLEFSGVGVYDTTATQNTPGGSLASLTAMPSMSIAPTTGDGLLVFVGMVAYMKSDGTMELSDVSQSGGIGSTMVARNQGERPNDAGTYGYCVAGWQGHAVGLGTGAHASVPTLTWTGGGTTKPSTGCQQRAIAFKAA